MSNIYVGRTNDSPPRIKAVTDADLLPDNLVQFSVFTSTANMSDRRDRSERFWHYYDRMKWLEQIGFNICIDFGSHFYETGDMEPTIT